MFLRLLPLVVLAGFVGLMGSGCVPSATSTGEGVKSFLAARGLSVTNASTNPEPETRPPLLASGNPAPRPAPPSPAPMATRTPATRTHRVVAGESPVAIARKYNVKLDAFMAANPGLNATRMRIGQIVYVPGQ